MPNSQERLVSVAVTDGVSAWERHDLLLMLLLMLLAAAGWEALGLRFTVAVAVTVAATFLPTRSNADSNCKEVSFYLPWEHPYCQVAKIFEDFTGVHDLYNVLNLLRLVCSCH